MASRDLRAALHMLAADPPFTEEVAFHAQQAAEKSLKAFLFWHDVRFRKTHELAQLSAPVESLDPTLKDLCDRAADLTSFAWIFRYPDEQKPPTLEEAKSWLDLARAVYEAMLSRLPREVDPAHAGPNLWTALAEEQMPE